MQMKEKTTGRVLILFIQTLALYKSFTDLHQRKDPKSLKVVVNIILYKKHRCNTGSNITKKVPVVLCT